MQQKKNLKIIIAETVSYILDPVFLGLLIIFTLIFKSKMPHEIMMGWLISAFVLNALIPAAAYWFFTNHGYVFDDKLSNSKVKKQRIIIFIIFLASMAIELLIMTSTQIYQPFFNVLAGGIVTIVIGSFISYFWKISVHSSMSTFFASMVVIVFGWQFWPIFAIIPLVVWSRLVMHRHNLYQLIAGIALSLTVVELISKFL